MILSPVMTFDLERSFKEIYPPELSLKKENIINTEGTFYDLDIAVKNGKFDLKLYDKRDAFNFSIFRFPLKKVISQLKCSTRQ